VSLEPARDPTYHAGERYVQDRAGQAAAATAAIGAIHASIPPPAAVFLAEREMLVVAASDDDGRIWATHLTGAPGFIHVVSEREIHVAAQTHAHDPLANALARRAIVGTIAIDFATRRRMRLNGTSTADAGGLTIVSDQVYANCPKFIAARSVESIADTTSQQLFEGDRLDDAARSLVSNAETLFIGTAHADRGADASHRGGAAGFVAVIDDRTLRFPDYRGNAMYMTLGNIVASPRTGLLFVDWESGDVLQLTGTAAIDWDPDLAARFPGAQRMVSFTIDRAVRRTNASPLRWSRAIPSRVNPPIVMPNS
jgi:predicted pyridoxine 5'-phosphate oxidase superfamily flavin-nucleotide-binding protein